MSPQLPQHINSLVLSGQKTNDEQIARYLTVAALAAVVWQMAVGIADDLEIAQRKLSASSALYFISRASALGLTILMTTSSLGVISHALCSMLLFVHGLLFTAAVCSTSLLFFFRVRAVFIADRSISALFFVLWLSVLGSCAYMPFSITGPSSLGVLDFEPRFDLKAPAQMCTASTMNVGCVTCIAAIAVYDTAVFIAISWRLLSCIAAEEGLRAWAGYLCGRNALPVISNTILHGSRKYYAAAICAHATAGAIMHASRLPYAVRVSLLLHYVIMKSFLACAAFRDVRASVLGSRPTSSDFSALIFQDVGHLDLAEILR